MSYVVFARKWRPQNFKQVIGQDEVVKRLKNAITQDRLGHAFLFAGPHGVGKTSTARILAKSLNCLKNGASVNPCNECASCKEIAEGRSLDVIEIDGASNRGIDEIRSLREHVKFAPARSKFKIYIIDEVHQITTDGFNALLKTLEEPPEFVKFIFATTHVHKVIPTILSRCQRFNFRKIPVLKIIDQLKLIVKDEKLSVEESVFLAIAKAADGALRDAESMLDELITFSKNKISLNDIISVLGIIDQEFLFEMTDFIIDKKPIDAVKLLDSAIEQGKDISAIINNLIEHFRNILVVKLDSNYDSQLIDLPQDSFKRLLGQSKKLSLKAIFSFFSALMGVSEAARKLLNFKIPLELAILRLATPVQQEINNDISPSIKKEEPVARDIKNEAKEEVKSHTKPVIRNLIEIDRVKELWPNILEGVSKIKVYIMHCLENTVPMKMHNNILTLGLSKKFSFHKDVLTSRDNRVLIEKVISELTGADVRFKLELLKQDLQEEQEQDEVINSALDIFKGQVIE
ncbi:MAG: DNA polymerase III subunit gamma/tau [Candidatus Gygaella obscura]|nr:DNA polymerase III subunit gamma/tau [Candidatus Gygaella obscura]